jgi:hypothetical protein
MAKTSPLGGLSPLAIALLAIVILLGKYALSPGFAEANSYGHHRPGARRTGAEEVVTTSGKTPDIPCYIRGFPYYRQLSSGLIASSGLSILQVNELDRATGHHWSKRMAPTKL